MLYLLKLISFCESVQRKSPVGSHIRPIPGYTSGSIYSNNHIVNLSNIIISFITLTLLKYIAVCDIYIHYDMIGYGEEVIFADGTFIEGSTLELSADGPLREPFVAYSQVYIYTFYNTILFLQLEQLIKTLICI